MSRTLLQSAASACVAALLLTPSFHAVLADDARSATPLTQSKTPQIVKGDPGAPAPGLRTLVIDASSNAGTLRTFQGVNGAAGPGGHKPEYFTFGGWNMEDGVDASAGYRLARIDLVRTHDAYGPTDIDDKFESPGHPDGALIKATRDVLTIFPDLNADPDNPRSYRFEASDKIIASIERQGAQVIYRLGRSEGADPTPPPDFDRYADIARHIVLHYNAGWANGFHYGIRYWEVWNEPDLGKVFWSGTPRQYFELYSKLARAVKQADPNALVGGPAIARPNDATAYQGEFLSYCKQHNIPLDFYSWHWYATDSNDPLEFARIAVDLRKRLDRGGFTSALSLLTEWNYGLESQLPATIVRANFITSAIIYMQDAPLDAATLYRADSVFGKDGATPDKIGQALIVLGQMLNTPVRLQVQGADRNGFAALAGRSQDGKRVQVLISNYQIPAEYRGPRAPGKDVMHIRPVFDVRLVARRNVHYQANAGFDLTLDHLPLNQPYEVRRCRISADQDLSASAAVTHALGKLRLQEQLPPPGIELITATVVDHSGAPVEAGADSCIAQNNAPPAASAPQPEGAAHP